MSDEVVFGRYRCRGAYHWEQVSRSIRRHNAITSARYDAILSTLGELNGRQCLDIGGGDGALSYLIARRGARVVNIDMAEEALQFARTEFARRGMRAQVAQASAYALPCPSDAFDVAVCSEVIEHVRSPEALVAEAVRVLRPGGRFVLTTPLRVTEKPWDREHVREFLAGELETLLRTALTDVTVMPFAPLALLELYGLPFRWLGNRPIFRYLFNIAAIYGRRNPLAAQGPFRFFSLLLATGRKPERLNPLSGTS